MNISFTKKRQTRGVSAGVHLGKTGGRGGQGGGGEESPPMTQLLKNRLVQTSN